MFNLIQQFQHLFRPAASSADIKRKYNLPANISLTVRLTADGWFVATSPDLPGLVTQARNQRALLRQVNDAVLSYFDVPKHEASVVYDRFDAGDIVMQYQGQLQTQNA
ncbi:TPA: hypothetical protein DEP96_03745 [Candidatus Uhrbacteria bacterium]|nr:hypothetical protein [Candidatus Uhrbacteria bacterium]